MQNSRMGQILSCFNKVPCKFFKISLLIFIFFGSSSYAQDHLLKVIPEPVYSKSEQGVFLINSNTKLIYNTDLKRSAELLNEAIRSYTGFVLSAADHFKNNDLKSKAAISGKAVAVGKNGNQILLKLDAVAVKEKEGYQLKIENNRIEIIAHDQEGLFYGLQSLIQLFKPASKISISVPNGNIKDYPRFGYRGMHLDVSRHMYSVDFLKKFIDMIAAYKFNIFHWHLTDDQGWRIEIKKYPKLQSVAAWREGTIIGHKKETPHTFDGIRYGGYYTQDQIRDVVRYASSKYVNILPEIEMPGHASAALAAYPELGCTGGPYHTAQFWGVFDDVFCAGNEQVYQFMEDILDEVVTLFPYSYVHIGGDECPKLKWKQCPKCQQRIKDNNLKDEHELQGYFMKRIEKYLKTKNRKAVGWDEVLEGGVTKETTIMNWRGEQSGIAAAKEQYNVIMTPENILYFDYYQSLNKNEPVASASYTPLAKVYNYEPVPDSLRPEEAAYIKGVQAGVWSEYLTTSGQLEYMVFPRALALSEIAWSPKGMKDYPYFLEKLRHQEPFLKKKKINYFPYFDEIESSVNQEKNKDISVSLTTTLPGAEIRYTLDKTVPTNKSTLYQFPIVLNHTAVITAQLFLNGQAKGRIFDQSFTSHLAIQKEITLVNPPAGKYNMPAGYLLNGFEGNHRFNNGQWLGFNGDDLDALIDLDSIKPVSKVGINILNYHWQRMWAPKKLTIEVSEDGKEFKEVFSGGNFDINGINRIRVEFPLTKARYIRVLAKNIGRIPVGEYGEGEKAWLMADEIIVN